MLIYHGSKEIIEKPVFGKGKIHNDYGRGFYCTYHEEMAKEWAVDIDRDGFANSYEIDDSGLVVLNLSDKNYSVLSWLAVLLENRVFDTSSQLAEEARQYIISNFTPKYKDADIIIGWRADDSYFSFAQDFLNGTITYEQLGRAMALGKLGLQYVLKSKKAFDQIKFAGAVEVQSSEYYQKRKLRDEQARSEYANSKKNPRKPKSIYITTILDEEMRPGDDRL